MKSEDYEFLFENLVDQIKANVGSEIVDTINFNFSTSDKITKVVGYTSIMSAMKQYFEYCGFCHMCNYPYIILKGTLEDWVNILKKTSDLSKYNLEKQIYSLIPILLNIIETKKGNINKEFWKDILHPDKDDERVEIGMSYKYKTIQVDGIKGWLLNFFPYFRDGKYRHDLSSLKVKGLYKIPDKLLEITLLMKSDDEGETILTIYSGFLGMKVDEEKNNLVTPEIGWFVKLNSENDEKGLLRGFNPFRLAINIMINK